MNLKYWGIQLPLTDGINEPGTALPVIAFGGTLPLEDAGDPQVIAIADDAVDTLTVPDGAIYAKIQNNGAAMWYSTDGTDPVIATGNGFKVADTTITELWGPDALANFKARAHTSGTGKIYVEYKRFVRDIVAISEA